MSETMAEYAKRTGKTERQALREIQDKWMDPRDAARGRQVLAVSMFQGGATYEEIGRHLNVSKTAVGKYLRRAREEGTLER